MEHNAIIRERRSVYTNMFSGEKVPGEIIEEMLENARWAPTHRMTEPWQFVVFEGEGLKRLGNYQASAYQQRNQGNVDEAKMEKLRNKPLECSHVIAIGMHRDEKETVPEVEEICSVACAVQNMWLTASAHRIGCYWSTGGITFYDGVNDFFGWKEQDRLLGFLFIGMSGTDRWPVGKRSSMADKVRWER